MMNGLDYAILFQSIPPTLVHHVLLSHGGPNANLLVPSTRAQPPAQLPSRSILELANRNTRELPLTLAEASQMAEAGFRFAEFNPEQGRYRQSKPP